MTTARPNILCIMSDEHDPAVLGCYGDPLVQTPHLDGLAQRGVTFDACYCNSPLCVPSRLSFTACQYVSRCGAWNNGSWLPSDDYPSLPRALRGAGYTPYLCGKQHYDASRRYGFEDLAPRFNQNFKSGGGSRRAATDDTVKSHMWEQRSSQFYPAERGGILDHDREVTATALQFLKSNTSDEPWFLFAGYLAPHFPLIVPEEYYARYRGKVPMPEIPDGLLENLPRNYRHHRNGFGSVLADDDITQRGRDLYWALTSWFDNEVGKLLAAIDERDDADNTIIIYTSDHGENKGDHGLWWKNCMYEHGARVPLMVSWPARLSGGQRRTEVCSLVDLVQTITQLAGGEAYEQWDGDSLVPLLDDVNAEWKDFAVSEYYSHPICSGFQMLREGPWKYVYHTRPDDAHEPERELYNLDDDPKEFTNLADRPEQAERIARMHAALVAELGEDLDAIEQRCRADFARGYGRTKPEPAASAS